MSVSDVYPGVIDRTTGRRDATRRFARRTPSRPALSSVILAGRAETEKRHLE